MGLIEQAARRLEELRRSGVVIPDTWPTESSAGAGPQPANDVYGARSSGGNVPEPGSGHMAPAVPQRPPKASESVAREVRIDLVALADKGYLSPDRPRSRIADEFRVIKRPLLNNIVSGQRGSRGNPPNLVMVTSSLPNEGKTFVSVNLAMSLAMELDKTVLLVDADVARPSVLQRLGLEPTKGLLDLLTDSQLDFADVLLRTNVDGLSILPAGTSQDRATEILASDKMMSLLEDLSGRYPERIVVFDAPPLLPSTESRVLATHMGQVVFVVEAARTRSADIERALQTIESCEAVFPLLNKGHRSEVGTYYGYYGPRDD